MNGKHYHVSIEWDVEDVDSPAAAAQVMWSLVRESDGPVVELTDRDSGAVHTVDLYELMHGSPY